MRILLIEEDAELTKRMTDKLADAGFVCDVVNNFKDGDYYYDIRHYNLLIVDWTLAGCKEFIATARYHHSKDLIIALSGRDDIKSEIEALNEGVDDYLRKPFDMDVLLARIEARLRRSGIRDIIKVEELTIDTKEETVSYQGRDIDLKGKVFEVFAYLAMQRDKIISKEQLLDALWVEPELVTPNVIDVAITQIRQKMDKPLGITTIETVRRRGYRFCYPN
ncbi:MAG: homeostatic response regulator transcription factor HsrA [Gammaproteobacteria bacterium]|nr:homeostatic response regulator transcription factor HsrA [Gammaproteobacteria bacterium]